MSATRHDELALNAEALAWSAAWRDYGSDLQLPELPKRVRRSVSMQRWLLASELLLTVSMLAIGVAWVKKAPGVQSFGWLVGVALFAPVALGFSFWNRAGKWRPAAETTRGYLDLAIARCEMHIMTARFSWWFVIAESGFLIGLTAIVPHTSDTHMAVHFAATGVVVAVLLVGTRLGVNWYVGRNEREMERLKQLRADLAAPVAATGGKALSTILAILLPASLGLFAGARTEAADLELEPCQLHHPLGVTSVSAQCGKLRVPENREMPEGRHIELHVARVSAISRRKQPDPLFVIAGGPGGSSADMYTSAGNAFGRIRRERDIILVDQRGTGQSNPLTCEFDESMLYTNEQDELARLIKSCQDTLSANADLAQYTTSIAVQDLDAVRQALGYERINVYGASYGTRVAQHYARRFPAQTRTMILDGVVPPELLLGPTISLDAEAALNNVLTRCAQDEACSKRFGDLTSKYHALRKTLNEKPVPVTLPHPTTGELEKVEFGPMHLATVLRLGLYTSEQAALVPLEVDLAVSSGNFVPLAGQLLVMSNLMQKSIAIGMHNSVVCAEDVPFYDSSEIDREAIGQTFLGSVGLETLEIVCKSWPRGPMDADFREPLKSDIPTLLLSGGNDPVTPARFGEQVKRGLSESLHIVIPDLGHGQLGAPCMDRVMERFVAEASVKTLDVSCTKNVKPMPFFTSISGPPA